MRSGYYDLESRAMILLDHDMWYPHWTIGSIRTPDKSRGRGLASKLLKEVCEAADNERVVLYLEIIPGDGLDYEQLEAWYMRHDFKYIGSDAWWMRRRPNNG